MDLKVLSLSIKVFEFSVQTNTHAHLRAIRVKKRFLTRKVCEEDWKELTGEQ